MISIDTETTGVDLRHGAEPFLVTICNDRFENTWWEWDVDPLTRRVLWIRDDVDEIISKIEEADVIVGQNIKFDATALSLIFPSNFKWPWHKTEDTLIQGHLLASNHPHDLTSMCIEYLTIDISPYEEKLKKAVTKCRSLVRRKHSPIGNWRIANKGLPEIPSAKESTWKFDMWLPRAVARFEPSNEDEKKWYADEVLPMLQELNEVTANYSNTDSATTIALYLEQAKQVENRSLQKIYRESMKLSPVIYKMESRGMSVSAERKVELEKRLQREADEAADICCSLSNGKLKELSSGITNALRDVVFNDLKLIPAKCTDTGNPSMDKYVLDDWIATLPPERERELKFVQALKKYRSRTVALGYLDSYEKFWLPTKYKNWYRLFPSLNQTGTATLRGSSNGPNEQQISKQEEANLRYIFGPMPGREWWSMDAKNIELRIPAYESGEKELIDLFERPDDPPYYGSTHLLNFHTVYPDIWERELKEVGIEKVGPHCKKKYASSWYQWCKNGGFAIQYGAMDRTDRMGTADKAFHRQGSHARLKSRFSKLEKLNQYYINQANRVGYVETIPDKSIDPERGYPLLCTRSEHGSVLPTVPLSYHVQSTAMQWMRQGMIRCQEYLDNLNRQAPGLSAYLIAQIHDEVLFDFPKSKKTLSDGKPSNYVYIRKLGDLMAKGGDDIGVPTPVGIEYHPICWSEGVTV